MFKALKRLVITLIVLSLALFGFTKVIRYPDPISAIRLGLAPASKTPTLMPWHEIAPAEKPIEIPKGDEVLPTEVQYLKTTMSWQGFLDETYTNAFLVIRNGVLTHEWYREGFTAEQRLPSYSVAKTMTSIMIGQLIEAGKIKELDYFIDYFPEYKNGSAFDRVTVKSLLDMQSGVGVSDNYPTGPQGWGVAIAQMYATTDLNWFIGNNRKMFFEPGLNAEYRSVDTQMLGMIIKKVTGMRVADYFSENVWQKVGAEFLATWNVDRVGGTEKTFCCFNAAARDYARVGMAILNGGFSGSTRIISRDWLNRMNTSVVTLDHNWGYAAQVWHPFPGTSMALGLYGQFIFIDPESRTVIVKLSDNPPGSDTEEPTAEVLYALAKAKR
ncbi:MAG: class C beta-lactamase-related serine hydrolase [Actinobacteria bacterium]|nr:class C beta-lactamase-related serine hydrolase [Actinomycetota bacterium]